MAAQIRLMVSLAILDSKSSDAPLHKTNAQQAQSAWMRDAAQAASNVSTCKPAAALSCET
eukprot:CAMPEP_0184120668 /NCGR_PEP_ID=MMETSP0974-20121125/22579_1 /TAXON_ID=483370 /ORGANISM="non described non described, Strain CCMP2097" /LENGTH=59 /DNA_ID=CAMNT_0026423859 /DNA_START=32 /DNA_END=211 /DNA_ORIENTATION=-